MTKKAAQEVNMTEPLKAVDEQPAVEPEIIKGGTATAKSGLFNSVEVPDLSDIKSLVIDDGITQKLDEAVGIPKPKSKLAKFRSDAVVESVEPLLTVMPVHRHCDAKDHVRLHPDKENYWSTELCFVNVPIKGVKSNVSHLIVKEIATKYLRDDQISYHGLALATKPFDTFFLCTFPTQNLDNSWNASNLTMCENSLTLWGQSVSRRSENVDAYRFIPAVHQDAFPAPKWPKQNLEDIILAAYQGKLIDCEDHPALLRIIGARQQL
jgi:hypothetical protein